MPVQLVVIDPVAAAADEATAAATAAAATTARPVVTDLIHVCDGDAMMFTSVLWTQMPFSCTEIGLPTYSSTEPIMKVLGGVRGVLGW